MRGGGRALAICMAVSLLGCSLPGTGELAGDPPTASASASASAPSETTSPSDTPSEAPSATGGLETVYTETFSVDETGWPIGKGGENGLSTNSYRLRDSYAAAMTVTKPAKGGIYRMLAPHSLAGYGDVEVTVDARKNGGPGPFGVMCFQSESEWGGYEFGLDSDGTVAIIERGSESEDLEVLATDVVPDLVRPRGGNTIIARCVPGENRTDLAMSVNGVEVLRIADADRPVYQSGSAGVHIGVSRRGRAQAVFDNFYIRGVPRNEPPAPLPTPSPTPTELTGDEPFVDESFNDEFSGWEVVEPGQGIAGEVMGYVSGEYVMKARPPNRGFATPAPVPGEPSAGDVIVETRLKFDRGRGLAGVFCRGSEDHAEAYLAALDTKGRYTILRLGGNAPRPLTEPGATDPAFKKATDWNTVTLECLGTEDDTTIRLSINDRLVAEVVDPDPLDSAGELGLFVTPARKGDRLDARFDDFVAKPAVASV